MRTFVMVLKSGVLARHKIVFKTKAEDLSAAKKYFVKLKDLPEEKFDEIYIVLEEKHE